jgi:hypothetical protein
MVSTPTAWYALHSNVARQGPATSRQQSVTANDLHYHIIQAYDKTEPRMRLCTADVELVVEFAAYRSNAAIRSIERNPIMA